MSGRRRKSHQSSDNPVSFGGDEIEFPRTSRSDEFEVRLNVHDVDAIIKKFSGDNSVSVKHWIDEFESYANTFKWNELQRYVFCKRSLVGAAKLFVEYERKPLTYRDLRTALYTEFQPRLSAADVHKNLKERKKKPTESIREYLYKMIDIAAQAEVDDISIIHYVIDGIKDSTTNKIMLYEAKTIQELKEKLLTYEKIQENRLQESEASNRNNKSLSRYFKRDEKQNDRQKRYCYNCGSAEHEFHSCPDKAKGPKCFKCSQYGHKRADCEKRSGATVNFIKRNEMYRPVKANGLTLEGLIDTGSEISIIKKSIIKQIRPKYFSPMSRISVTGLGADILTKGSCIADIKIEEVTFENVELHAVEDMLLKTDIIIGMNVLNKATIKIAKGTISISKEHHDEHLGKDNSGDAECFLARIETATNESLSKNSPDLLYPENREIAKELKELIAGYLPENPPESPIRMKIVPMDNEPVYKPPRRFPPNERKIIENQIKEWLDKGIIRESTSDYCSQVVLVRKKDNSYRLCIDYRAINKKIHKDRYPLPHIEDQIDKLEGSAFFTTLDLENGFFHVSVEEESRRLTSFVTQDGQFEFLKVPFGLCNSPAVFQKYINYIFKDLIHEGVVVVYIDDIIIPSSTIKEGMSRLRRVLQVAAKNGLKIKWSKCQFLQKEITYLGHRVQQGMVAPSLDKTKAVSKFPVPTTAKQVQSFLGLAGYFRKFVPQFAEVAKPLSNLLKKGVKFHFGDEERTAFERLKRALSNKPVLRIFRYDATTELHTDASRIGYGAVLLQKDTEDGQFHPVHYMSRTTTNAEKNYSSYELEVLAIIEAVKKFRVYLLGHNFKIVTDCKAFECTMRKKDLTTRIARWALLLEEFHYEVEHRAGSRLKHVDALSRNPLVMCINQNSEFLKKLEEAQRKDERLNAIIELLKKGPYKDYVMYHNILCKSTSNNMLFVVPDNLKNKIIKEVHERGHFHARKMKEIIEKEYYMIDLQKRIEKEITSCVRCILAERKQGKQEGLLQPIPKGELPLDTLHIDHLGPMQAPTKKGYRYILAIVDAFTKYCWLFPTKTLNTDEVVQKLEVVAETFGYPGRLITDRGGAFISNQFRDYCSAHNINLHLITVGVPRGNGQVERLHSVVIAGLTKLSLNDAEKWYTHVKPFQRILNSTFQRAVGTTPFELLVGVKMKTEKDISIVNLIDEELRRLFEEERNVIRERAKLEIQKIQEENRQSYNKKRKQSQKYAVNDLVAVERSQFGVGLKIKPKFMGPYKVTSVNGFDRYCVEKIGEHEGPKTTSCSADKMKLWAVDEDSDSCDVEDIEANAENADSSSGADEPAGRPIVG